MKSRKKRNCHYQKGRNNLLENEARIKEIRIELEKLMPGASFDDTIIAARRIAAEEQEETVNKLIELFKERNGRK